MIDFTGLVVMFNEERRLEECLSSLKFCNQIIAIDLGSTDRSREIAEKMGAYVISHERVAIGEQARYAGYKIADNDWIFVIDPDEVVDELSFDLARDAIMKNPNLAALKLPMRNYFLGKELNSTFWGNAVKAPSIINKKRIHFVTTVHNDQYSLPGYDTEMLKSSKPLLKHYWVDNLWKMFEKHYRYVKLEGEARYSSGQRYSPTATVRALKESFVMNFVKFKGWRGGWHGWFLSGFHVMYVFFSHLSLRNFEKNIARGKSV